MSTPEIREDHLESSAGGRFVESMRCPELGSAQRPCPIGTGYTGRYQNRLKTPANRLHMARSTYQKKSCKSGLSQGFSLPPENRGVHGSIPGLAISSFA